MSAGLPGVGLSGVFFILSALLAVPLELVRTVRGRSTPSRWTIVLRHAMLALVMILALEAFYALVHAIVVTLRPPAHRQGRAAALHLIPVLPILLTLAAMACVTGAAKAAELLVRRQ
jgi:hypothetical protein